MESAQVSNARSQMALFYMCGCRYAGSRCSQSQRPLTHQSKKFLYSAAPLHSKGLFLSPLLLCFLLLLFWAYPFSQYKNLPCLFLSPFSVVAFLDLPSFSVTSSFYLISCYLLSTSIRLPLYPAPLKWFFSPASPLPKIKSERKWFSGWSAGSVCFGVQISWRSGESRETRRS